MLITFILLLSLLGLLITLATYLAWPHINFSWLDKLCTALVFSLPFEQIPSIELAGANFRPSQIIILIGFWTLLILFIKKDSKLLSSKINQSTWWLIGLITLSIPSWFFVTDFNRFLITYVATLLCFGGTFLLANFAENIWNKLRWLVWAMLGVGIFGVYQFFGDLLGIPYTLTGLREHYTQRVFGFPRIHSTALEPLYFAGMLFLPIILTFIAWFSHKSIILPKLKSFGSFALFMFFTVLFLVTISKSAFLALGIALLAAVIVWSVRYPVITNIRNLVLLAVLGVSTLLGSAAFFPPVANSLQEVYLNFTGAISGQSVSAQERDRFLTAGLALLPQYVITGLGSGQYGVQADVLLDDLRKDEGTYFIVNNVYVEIWLEQGLLFTLVFVLFVFSTLLRLWVELWRERDWKSPHGTSIFVLSFALLAYLIQWTTFSPIYIMPIFIILGLSHAVIRRRTDLKG